jgi:hypothetical protein
LSGFEDELSPAELLDLQEITVSLSTDRKISLISLVKGWAKHVDRLETEHSSTHASDPCSWTVWDYIAALLLRDRIAETITLISDPLGSKTRAWVEKKPDAKLYSFTQADDSGIFARFASEIAEENLFSKGWWWSRVPVSGPVHEDLEEWAQSMGVLIGFRRLPQQLSSARLRRRKIYENEDDKLPVRRC